MIRSSNIEQSLTTFKSNKCGTISKNYQIRSHQFYDEFLVEGTDRDLSNIHIMIIFSSNLIIPFFFVKHTTMSCGVSAVQGAVHHYNTPFTLVSRRQFLYCLDIGVGRIKI